MKSIVGTRRSRKRRRGTNLLELLACVLLMSLMFFVLSRLTQSKQTDFESINAQYDVLAADAFIADIYRDYHRSDEISLQGMSEEEGDGRFVVLSFYDIETAASHVYSFSEADGKCYKDGVEQFDATRFEVVLTYDSLIVSVKLPDERVLEVSWWK